VLVTIQQSLNTIQFIHQTKRKMKKQFLVGLAILSTIFLFTFCQEEPQLVKGSAEHISKITSDITDEALTNADAQQGDWLSYGRNYKEDRYSTLNQITKENVKDLSLAWAEEIGTKRGLQATPLVVDGIMYFSGPFNKVWAYDVRTGEEIWQFIHDYNTDANLDLCCGFSNRGLAIYKGDLFMGTLDGKLLSIDATTGKKNWEVMTIPEGANYSITGAPRVVKGKVIIGNGGAELGARGFVTAYDAATGDQAWRFYTVPGDPSKPYEHEDLAEAAKTWNGDEYWKQGGGGTVWDAMAYDPELNLFYIGVGNGAHWNREFRSPGGGDNLYLSSIVALNPDDGSYVWHYQTTPGDSWDYTATQHIILADMEIEGKERKVLMQAPKNGYFYVIDRATGEFLSADNFVYQNWTTGMDENGRPIEAEGARYLDGQVHWIAPSTHGGHNWPPMTYNHQTGLVYIPTAKESQGFVQTAGPHDPNALGGGFDANVSLNNKLYMPNVFDPNPNAPIPNTTSGRLVAWNPKTQKEVWGIDQIGIYNGGLLSTATGLLMQGDAEGNFIIRDADDGKVLKKIDLRSGIVGSPITYMVDGEQYISILVGWGGYFPAQIGNGWNVFTRFCISCHPMPGAGHSSTPDLARSTDQVFENYDEIVMDGALAKQGMPALRGLITDEELTDLKSFIFYSSKELGSGMSPTDYLTNIAQMQYLADQGAQRSQKTDRLFHKLSEVR